MKSLSDKQTYERLAKELSRASDILAKVDRELLGHDELWHRESRLMALKNRLNTAIYELNSIYCIFAIRIKDMEDQK